MNAVAAIVPLILRSVATRGRILAMAALGLIGVGIAAAVRLSENWGSDSVEFPAAEVLADFGLTMLVPIVALVVASATLGNLVENRTLVYLWLRPVASWQIAVSALIAALIVVLPLVTIPLAAMAAIVGDGADIGGAVVASALGALGYTAVFTGLGLLTERALAWGLAYILVWEGFVAGLSRGAGRFAIRTYTTSALSKITDVADLIDSPYTVPTVVIVIAVIVVAAFAATSWRLDHQDIA